VVIIEFIDLSNALMSDKMITDTDKAILVLRKQLLNINGTEHRKTTTHLNKNSGVFLHCILTSIKFTNDRFSFVPSEETKKILNTFNQKDLVDTYYHLQLDPCFYPTDYVAESRVYVINKSRALINKVNKQRARQNGKNKFI